MPLIFNSALVGHGGQVSAVVNGAPVGIALGAASGGLVTALLK
jgi:hypothetical protein